MPEPSIRDHPAQIVVRRQNHLLLHTVRAHQLGKLIGHRYLLCGVGRRMVHQPQVGRAELLDTQRPQVVLHRGAKLLRSLGGRPATVGVANRAELGDDHQVLRVGVQRLADQLVGHVRPVVLGRVDVVDAQFDSSPQDPDRLVVVTRWAHHPRAGKLHRAESDPAHGEPAKAEGFHTPRP